VWECKDLLNESELSSLCVWNVFGRAKKRSSLVAHRLCLVMARVGECIFERMPSMVIRRYTSSSNV
jgi:hypothetical protein